MLRKKWRWWYIVRLETILLDKAVFEAGKFKDGSWKIKQELECTTREKPDKMFQLDTEVTNINKEKTKIIIALQDPQTQWKSWR